MAIQKLTIFLAEDDQDDCMIFQEALQELKCQLEVVVNRNGVELMNNLSKTTTLIPYVLFLDLNMPEKNGFECLKEIRHTEEFKGLPVVILSTSREESQILQSLPIRCNLLYAETHSVLPLVGGHRKDSLWQPSFC